MSTHTLLIRKVCFNDVQDTKEGRDTIEYAIIMSLVDYIQFIMREQWLRTCRGYESHIPEHWWDLKMPALKAHKHQAHEQWAGSSRTFGKHVRHSFTEADSASEFGNTSMALWILMFQLRQGLKELTLWMGLKRMIMLNLCRDFMVFSMSQVSKGMLRGEHKR